MGREHSADYSAPWSTNHYANKGGNSARRPTQETGPSMESLRSSSQLKFFAETAVS
jgi:hypothetical protein